MQLVANHASRVACRAGLAAARQGLPVPRHGPRATVTGSASGVARRFRATSIGLPSQQGRLPRVSRALRDAVGPLGADLGVGSALKRAHRLAGLEGSLEPGGTTRILRAVRATASIITRVLEYPPGVPPGSGRCKLPSSVARRVSWVCNAADKRWSISACEVAARAASARALVATPAQRLLARACRNTWSSRGNPREMRHQAVQGQKSWPIGAGGDRQTGRQAITPCRKPSRVRVKPTLARARGAGLCHPTAAAPPAACNA